MDLLQTIKELNRPLKIAHRGGMAIYPENTMLAFRESVHTHKVDMLELDLQLTNDCKAAVIHDPTVERTTNGEGKVSDFTFAEISKLDAAYNFRHDENNEFPQRGKGVSIPLFEDVVREFPETFLNPELKNTNPLLVYEVKRIVEKYTAHKRLLTGSGNYFQHQRIKKLLSECYHFMSKPDLYLFAYLGSLGLGKKYWHKFHVAEVPYEHNGLMIFHKFKKAAEKADLPIIVWGVDDKETIRIVEKMGVDGITTDRPDLL